MGWEWGPTNMAWQIFHTNGMFNPLQILNPGSAKSWLAQSSATNWATNSLPNRLIAIGQDAVGGYISAFTGSPASGAQAWWSTGIGAALPIPKGLSAAFSGLCTAADSLTGGAQATLANSWTSLAGLAGNAFAYAGARLPLSMVVDNAGQLNWTFAPTNLTRLGSILNGTGKGLDILSTGGEIANNLTKYGIGALKMPDVGGVLFENCDAVVTGICEITGAYWDEDSGCVVLIGRDAGDGPPGLMRLPNMDSDHLRVALRSAVSSRPMGVSIDPPSEYRDGMKKGIAPPSGTAMLVSYLGGTEGTLFGAIMFEADRLLKCLNLGVDNVTHSTVHAAVPGSRSVVDMIRPGGDYPSAAWHRFWFVIDKVEIRRDPSSGAVAFGDVRLKVLTETQMGSGTSGEPANEVDAAFASHLSQHYDLYAAEFPVLGRLKELAKVAALAKFLVNTGVEIDAGALFQLPVIRVDTPANTPGISVQSPNVVTQHSGATVQTRTVSLFGGVDMDCDPDVVSDGAAGRLRAIARAARPTPCSSQWFYDDRGLRTRAVASRIGAGGKAWRRTVCDYQFASTDGDSLALRRTYDSLRRAEGHFGRGWFLSLPYSMVPVRRAGKRQEVLTRDEQAAKDDGVKDVIVYDAATGTSGLYRRVESAGSDSDARFCRLVKQTAAKNAASFEYDPDDIVVFSAGQYLLDRRNVRCRFDSNGRLLEVSVGGGGAVVYQWVDDRIAEMRDARGHRCQMEYDKRVAAIVGIRTSDGRTLSYEYDRAGLLAGCRGGSADETYAYDARGCLTEVRRGGAVISRCAYDDFGQAVTGGSDAIAYPDGSRVSRVFDAGKVVALRDERDAGAKYTYGAKGELSGVTIRGENGRTWDIGFDPAGRLVLLKSLNGASLRLHYDAEGRVCRFDTDSGDAYRFERDARNRLAAVRHADGRCWRLTYGKGSRVVGVTGPGRERWRFGYSGDILVRISGPQGKTWMSPGRNSICITHLAADGSWRAATYDRRMRLTGSRLRGANAVKVSYESPRAWRVRSEGGVVSCRSDETGLIVTKSFHVEPLG